MLFCSMAQVNKAALNHQNTAVIFVISLRSLRINISVFECWILLCSCGARLVSRSRDAHGTDWVRRVTRLLATTEHTFLGPFHYQLSDYHFISLFCTSAPGFFFLFFFFLILFYPEPLSIFLNSHRISTSPPMVITPLNFFPSVI